MIVVSDTSPLNYLILIGNVDVLPALFTEVIVPTAVAIELRKPAAPSSVQQFIAHPPSWIVIRSATSVDATIHLGAGENEAISLAMELHADRILMDDRAANHAATQRGIRAIGTLTVLFDAAGRGLLRLPDALKRLQATNFRAPASIIRQLLALDAKRAPSPPQNRSCYHRLSAVSSHAQNPPLHPPTTARPSRVALLRRPHHQGFLRLQPRSHLYPASCG